MAARYRLRITLNILQWLDTPMAAPARVSTNQIGVANSRADGRMARRLTLIARHAQIAAMEPREILSEPIKPTNLKATRTMSMPTITTASTVCNLAPYRASKLVLEHLRQRTRAATKLAQ